MDGMGYLVRTMTVPRPVRYPSLRSNLKDAAWSLSNQEFQSEVWARPGTRTPPDRFPFPEAIAFVVDDMGMAEPSTLLGEVLASSDEQSKFEALSRALNALLDRIGRNYTFANASSTSEWDKVRSTAKLLFETMARSDRYAEGLDA
jgi:hypothetical protein